MAEEGEDGGWMKPKQSYRLKRTISRKRPVLGSVNVNRSLPVFSQSVKRKHSEDHDVSVSSPSQASVLAAKKQRLGEIFSPSSNFLQSRTIPGPSSLPSLLQRRVTQHSNSPDVKDCDSGVDDLSSSSSSSPGSQSSCPPLDWSLKTRLKFSSRSSLGWTQHLSTVEEASGVTGGVRCVCLNTSPKSQFHSHCLYWQAPSLPVPLFPRYSLTSGNTPSLSLSQEMQRAVHSDWMISFQSVYQLVKARQCPYFYLLAPQFSVLFRAAGISGTQEMSALLGPSSTGVRAALRREEIEFSLPLFKQAEDEVGSAPECDTTSDFLESLGIEADSLPGLSNHAPKNRLAAGAGSSQNIDGRAESLVLVTGVECQSLISYLLNAKLVAGKDQLPPTLLAPVAYHGGTLRSLKVRQSQVAGRPGVSGHHTVEVSGPVMPHMVQALTKLATSTNTDFTVALQTLEETVSFSMYQGTETENEASAPSAFATASLDDCGLQSEMLKVFCARNSTEENPVSIVRDLVHSDQGYRVNTRSDIGQK